MKMHPAFSPFTLVPSKESSYFYDSSHLLITRYLNRFSDLPPSPVRGVRVLEGDACLSFLHYSGGAVIDKPGLLFDLDVLFRKKNTVRAKGR